MKLTKIFIEHYATLDGAGYNKKQLAALGISWPPRTGWKKRLIGTSITDAQKEAYIKASKPKEPFVYIPAPPKKTKPTSSKSLKEAIRFGIWCLGKDWQLYNAVAYVSKRFNVDKADVEKALIENLANNKIGAAKQAATVKVKVKVKVKKEDAEIIDYDYRNHTKTKGTIIPDDYAMFDDKK